MSETLKSCPFCGGTVGFEHHAILNPKLFAVVCVKCGVITFSKPSKEEAAAVWNRRAPQMVDEKVLAGIYEGAVINYGQDIAFTYEKAIREYVRRKNESTNNQA